MDLNTIFPKYGNNKLWQTPSLQMVEIVMLLKVTNNMVGIAIHQAFQLFQNNCSRWCSDWHIVTYVLTTAIFENGGNKSRRSKAIIYLKSEYPKHIYSHTTIIALRAIFITIKQNKNSKRSLCVVANRGLMDHVIPTSPCSNLFIYQWHILGDERSQVRHYYNMYW